MTQRGFLDIYKTFNQHGWYWGAGFSGSSVDTMHFELDDQTIRAMDQAPLTVNRNVGRNGYAYIIIHTRYAAAGTGPRPA